MALLSRPSGIADGANTYIMMAAQGPSLLGAALLLRREVQERGRVGRGLQAHRQQPPTRQGAACQGVYRILKKDFMLMFL
jgi:hypothetical protein